VNKKLIFLFVLGLGVLIAESAFSVSEPMIFPKEGQSREQQSSDKQYCGSWAKGETGVDPSYVKAKLDMTNDNVANAASGEEPRFGRRMMRAAALGAAMGGIDDGIDNNVGKRAVQGAVLGGSRTRQDRKQYQKEQQLNGHLQKKTQLEEQYDKFMRAFAVCMDAKGYSVK
jgi:hypothetical protein